MAERGIALVDVRGGTARELEMDQHFDADMQPWQDLWDASTVGFAPAHFGAEAQLVFDAIVACAEIVERDAPRVLLHTYCSDRVASEVEFRARLARSMVETVAMAELHYEYAIPLAVVDLVVGYVHPWRGSAPRMALTPAQRAGQDAFAARHAGS
jgi:hypothetical protein